MLQRKNKEEQEIVIHIMFIEVKWNDDEIAKGLKYLKKRFPQTQAFQISAIGKKDYVNLEGIRVCPALKFLSGLV